MTFSLLSQGRGHRRGSASSNVGGGDGGTTVFSDGFESGDLTNSDSGFYWNDHTATVTVNTSAKKSGTYGAQFRFGPDALGADSDAELKILFGHPMTEFSLRYFLYLPSNFVHRSDGVSNNKGICQLWSGAYGAVASNQFIGFEYWPDSAIGSGAGGSVLASRKGRDGVDLGNYYGPPDTAYSSMFRATDVGKWHQFRVYVKLASGPGMNDGIIRAWRYVSDGSPSLEYEVTDWGYCTAGNYIDQGYILGYSNSGFTDQTDIYIDDFVLMEGGLVDWGTF